MLVKYGRKHRSRTRFLKQLRACYRQVDLLGSYSHRPRQTFFESMREFLSPCQDVCRMLPLCLKRTPAKVAVIFSTFLLFSFIFINDTKTESNRASASSSHNSWLGGNLLRGLTYWSREPTPSLEPTPFPLYGPDCDALLDGDYDEIQITQEMLYGETRDAIFKYRLQNLIKNCTNFKSSHSYATQAYSKEEQNFPVAYIISAFENYEQVEKLLQTIYSPQNLYCIHGDKTSSSHFHNVLTQIARCFDNVFIASPTEPLIVRGYYHLKADISCMQEFTHSRVQWKYVIKINESDFPLKTNLEIISVLKSLNGKNDIISAVPPNHKTSEMLNHNQVKSKPIMPGNRQIQTTALENITIYFGNAHFLVSRLFVDYVLASPKANQVLEWMSNNIPNPEQYFWATVNNLPSAPGGGTIPAHRSLVRAIKQPHSWGGEYHTACQGKYDNNLCIYGVGDLHWLSRQRHLFAGKLDIEFDHVVLQCLADRIQKQVSIQLDEQRSSGSELNSTYQPMR